jgi:hypothetical protein
MVREHVDPRDHDEQRYDLARYRRRAAAEPLVEPQVSEGNRDNRIARSDDGQHRREQRALLERVLVEYEAGRADHGQRVDRPVGEHVGESAADVRDHQLDQERRRAVADTAGQGQRERAQVIAALGNGETSRDARHQSRCQREHDIEADGRHAVGRAADHQEAGHARCGRDDAGEDDRIEPASQVRRDDHREDQVAYQERLNQGQRPVPERDYLKPEPDDAAADSDHPQRLPDQVKQDPR